MFSEEELDQLRSCWILPDGTHYVVPGERHDDNLPPGFRTIESAEKRCFRMSFGWGWTAPISQMTIACERITEEQRNVIKYLLKSGTIKEDQICALNSFGRDRQKKRDLLEEILSEI